MKTGKKTAIGSQITQEKSAVKDVTSEMKPDRYAKIKQHTKESENTLVPKRQAEE